MMFHDMFRTQHLSFMLMEMVVMMFHDMFTTQHVFHVDGDGGDDVP